MAFCQSNLKALGKEEKPLNFSTDSKLTIGSYITTNLGRISSIGLVHGPYRHTEGQRDHHFHTTQSSSGRRRQ
jgi:hypothetical protein